MSTIGAMTDYLENKLINHLLRNTSLSSPSNVYIALCTVTPSDIRSGTEVSGAGYSRVAGAFTVSGNYASNTAQIIFPIATENWGSIVGVGIWDSLTSGNLLFWGNIDNTIEINTSEQYTINVGMLNIELKGGTKGGWGISTANSLLKHILTNVPFSTPGANVYMALGNSLLTDADYNFSPSGSAWTETSTSGTTYSRKQVGGTIIGMHLPAALRQI